MSLWSTLKRLWTGSPEPVYEDNLPDVFGDLAGIQPLTRPLGDTGHPGASPLRMTGGDRGPETLSVLREARSEDDAVRGF